MKLLALDTSSLACTVAVEADGRIVERHEEQPREHTRILIPMIRAALAEARLSPADLDAVVLGNGPGSFIGMRIAASVAQGLAYAAGIRIVPVSSLAAVAAQVFAAEDAEFVAVTQDAHMDEVYLGLYERAADGAPAARIPERIRAPAAIPELRALAGRRVVAAGLGWQRYPDMREANRDSLVATSNVVYPHARYLLGIGRGAARGGGAIDPRDLEPAYLRQKVAATPGEAR